MADLLIVDDDALFRKTCEQTLNAAGYTVEIAATGEEALKVIKKKIPSLVLCDYYLPDIRAEKLVEELYGKAPVIVITGHASIPTAVELIKKGAYNYLVKPVMREHLLREIETTLKVYFPADLQKMLTSDPTAIPAEISLVDEMLRSRGYVIGTGEAAERMRLQIRRVAPTSYSVIIQGESGTGKEATALAVHLYSKGRNNPFIAVDCGVLSAELARSELFGHEKGAFTGANFSRKGQFRLADGGTLFLDEIVNLPIEVQSYLLRVLQDGEIYPVGSQKGIQTDVRIIAASNVELQQAVREGRFREDLFHRLNEYTIQLRPLREQKEDIMPFARQFLVRVAKEIGREQPRISPEVEKIFLAYHWPGNLREMKNTIRKACLLADDGEITVEHLQSDIFQLGDDSSGISSQLDENIDQPQPSSPSLRSIRARSEQNRIIQALHKQNFNKSKVAKELGIDRKTLYNKLKKYKIDV